MDPFQDLPPALTERTCARLAGDSYYTWRNSRARGKPFVAQWSQETPRATVVYDRDAAVPVIKARLTRRLEQVAS